MKKHITKLIGIALVAFYLLGCDDDELQPEDPRQTDTSVQFERKQDEHLEDGGEKERSTCPVRPWWHPTNLFWAFIYNPIGIPLAAGILYPLNGFLLDPMIAGAAMAEICECCRE